MADGKEQVATGGWKVAGLARGKWQVADGEWRVASGRWCVVSGEW